jgi:arylsulfatase A-like enzyme
VLELAGVERPEGLEGRSLVPLLRGDDDLDWRQEVLYEFYQGRMYGGFPTTLAVRGERHKLITYPGYPSWTELYDLEADPHEMVDLADESEHAGLRARMERRLEALEAELGGARPLERPSKDTPSRKPAREAGRDADQDE